MNKTISVIIPIYNMEKFAEDCIKSVTSQSYKNIEIIAVNDGSTDSSAEIVEKMAKEDSRIKLFSKPNAGLAHTRNFGLDRATGDYLMFLDCDDMLEANSVERMLSYAEENNADIVSASIVHFSSKGNDFVSSPPFDGMYTGKGLEEVRKNVCIGSNEAVLNLYVKIYRRSLLENNGIRSRSLVSGDDAAFALDAIMFADSIYFARNVKFYRYRDNPASFTKKYLPIEKRLEFSKLFFEAVESILEKHGKNEYKKCLDVRKSLSVYDFSMICVKWKNRTKSEVLNDLRYVCDDKYHLSAAVSGEGIGFRVNHVVNLAKKKKIKNIYYFCKAVISVKTLLKR